RSGRSAPSRRIGTLGLRVLNLGIAEVETLNLVDVKEVSRVAPERRVQVLGAIVQDYVRSREPVGSRNLVDRHNLGVSPATIRNDMAVLEEEGYIAQPHTSAGRIPTDKGYRMFVDEISEIKPLS